VLVGGVVEIMAKEIKVKEDSSKTWIMTLGVVFESEETKESAMRDFQSTMDDYVDNCRMIEVISCKQANLSFKLVEGE